MMTHQNIRLPRLAHKGSRDPLSLQLHLSILSTPSITTSFIEFVDLQELLHSKNFEILLCGIHPTSIPANLLAFSHTSSRVLPKLFCLKYRASNSTTSPSSATNFSLIFEASFAYYRSPQLTIHLTQGPSLRPL